MKDKQKEKNVKLNSEKIKLREQKIKHIKLGVLIIILFLTILYFLLSIAYEGGNFTVSLDENFAKKSGIVMYESKENKEDKRVWVKVEIQIKTMAMDFWSCIEHKVKYKSSKEISKRDSKKLKVYAKIISKINRSMIKMYKNNYKYIEN